ncbi:MAG: DUF3160 domain-containing protein, partial [Candidatus Latescibacteria bacterium]|nr:DUF3160 domain-containing protein [Candidatus Latescibacterota bacterium]
MKNISMCILSAVIFTVSTVSFTSAESIGVITGDVETEFATYKPVLIDVTPSVKPYTISSDLKEVANISDFDLTDGAKSLLASNGFAASASLYRQIYDVYNECEMNGIPAFVTTDACLHTYHILYDFMLRILEIQ